MLASWNDGAAKSMIVDFAARVTREGGPEYVRPAERIATFAHDGTLRCEQPVVSMRRDRWTVLGDGGGRGAGGLGDRLARGNRS